VKNFGCDCYPDALANHQCENRGQIVHDVLLSPFAVRGEEHIDLWVDGAQSRKCPSLKEANPIGVPGARAHRPVDEGHVIPTNQVAIARAACVVLNAERQLEKFNQAIEWIVDHDVGSR
jgi:hypothetical protein